MTAQHKSVSFDAIEIIQFRYCLGDNPSVTKGSVPISIEWDAQARTTLPLDYFERSRPAKQPQVRRFSPRTREKILLRTGYTAEEIKLAIVEAMAIRRERTCTLQQLYKLGALKQSRRSMKGESGEDRPPILPDRSAAPPPSRIALLPKAA
eukprot:CAMPEP_0117052542 /NCGR_PEP_ID=MMETSP0472-20121206/36316_1 /TAXON_ID=693140 ORGANISM="Tiarina fusus, Strain LIS" /NCGR_SAMPLE_ID=MMETSP0472 /ASSEMBLY_ACC=CAM_ASM_000603 /LENGTH=150 /DNA_ID=CAMNT_0004767203 /DNA_START=24 /DNA_END=476 /DNA_ORIENTATION=+